MRGGLRYVGWSVTGSALISLQSGTNLSQRAKFCWTSSVADAVSLIRTSSQKNAPVAITESPPGSHSIVATVGETHKSFREDERASEWRRVVASMVGTDTESPSVASGRVVASCECSVV